ncbi:MAG TPA: DUF6484 domain-containing protein [Acidobacteriaceae bacterium]|nr:DUF6484 domain-containing protein [Acidobacteriaceae bacterium]
MSGRSRAKHVAVVEQPAVHTQELRAGLTFPSGCVAIGRILGTEQGCGVLVDFPANGSGELVTARSTVPWQHLCLGQEVTLAFEEGDLSRPIVVGILQSAPGQHALSARPVGAEAAGAAEVLELTAGKEIVLRCGSASITLTKAGKVLIRGEYVLSRSSGANRIKGGSVQIN